MTYLPIQRIKQLRTREGRSQAGEVIVEGLPEIRRALSAHVPVTAFYWCPEIVPREDLGFDLEGLPVEEVSRGVFAKMAFGERLKGVLAVCRPYQYAFENLVLPKNPLVVILEAVEKPGNLGTILRTADASGADAVILCDSKTDIYNQHVVRSSIGAVFHVPVIASTKENILPFLQTQHLKIFVASARAEKKYTACDLSCGTAIVFGNEHGGVSEFWQGKADASIAIPVTGVSSSLNVAASTAVILYEARRQRDLKGKTE